MTTNMTALLERNEKFTRSFTPVPLALPAARVIIVTCLDHRVAPEITLGLRLGDAPVLRNAGGRVTQPIIEEIAYLAFLGTRLSGGQLPADYRVEVRGHSPHPMRYRVADRPQLSARGLTGDRRGRGRLGSFGCR